MGSREIRLARGFTQRQLASLSDVWVPPLIRGDDPRGMKNRKQARANRLLSQVCTGTSGNAKSYPTTEKSKATWLDTEADQRSRL